MIKLHKITAAFIASTIAIGAGSIQAASANTKLPFDDISGSYARQEIIDLVKEGVVNGTGPRTFEPKKNVTRAELIAMTDRLLKLEPVDSDVPAFSDVSRGSWYYGWVQAGINLGIVEGVNPKQFKPQLNITRAQAAALIVRALKQEGVSGSQLPFHDRVDIAEWAVPYVKAAYTLGIMKGDSAGNFRPNDYLTREETASLLDRVLQDRYYADPIHSSVQSGIQMGWQNELTTSQFIQKIKTSNINTMVPRWFFLENGNVPLSNYTDRSLITYAKQSGKQLWAMLGNHSDANLTHQILSDPTKKNAVIRQLENNVISYGINGINVDFENVMPQDRRVLTAFITDLATALHNVHAALSIDVSPDLGTDWTDAFDYAALGQAADYVVLMGYDEHWDGDPIAGSVSSLPWVQSALDTMLASVPASKTILALPFYTRDWTLIPGSAVSEDLTLAGQGQRLKTVPHTQTWDTNVEQYIASYTKQGFKHQIWVEDSRSLSVKYRMGAARGIAGFAYWYAGAESADVWTSLNNAVRYSSYNW